MAELVTLKLRHQRWRLRAANLAIWALVAVEWLVPGSIDEDLWTERLAGFVVAGMRVGS